MIFLKVWLFISAALLLVLSSFSASAGGKLAIIIDDLGHLKRNGYRAINLPGPLVYSLLPRRDFTHELAMAAQKKGSEILLHQPMESTGHHHMGPGALYEYMTQQQTTDVINENLTSIPGVLGINNHMGSLLTQRHDFMEWVMETLTWHDLYFVDSVTSPNSVAYRVAQEKGIRALRRDIFLDSTDDRLMVKRQLLKAMMLSLKQGTAVAIGHPYDSTLSVLEEMLPQFEKYGVTLVGLKDIYAARQTVLSQK